MAAIASLRSEAGSGRCLNAARGLAAALVVLAGLGHAALAAEPIALDKRQLRIAFAVKSLGLFTTEGEFRQASGELALDRAHVARSRLRVTVDTALLYHATGEIRRYLPALSSWGGAVVTTWIVIQVFAPPPVIAFALAISSSGIGAMLTAYNDPTAKRLIATIVLGSR